MTVIMLSSFKTKFVDLLLKSHFYDISYLHTNCKYGHNLCNKTVNVAEVLGSLKLKQNLTRSLNNLILILIISFNVSSFFLELFLFFFYYVHMNYL